VADSMISVKLEFLKKITSSLLGYSSIGWSQG
jgi:hypothetical protein